MSVQAHIPGDNLDRPKDPEFATLVRNSSRLIVALFYAAWDPVSCDMLQLFVGRAQQVENAAIMFLVVDADNSTHSIYTHYDVRSVPVSHCAQGRDSSRSMRDAYDPRAATDLVRLIGEIV